MSRYHICVLLLWISPVAAFLCFPPPRNPASIIALLAGKGFGAEKETVPAKEYPPLSQQEVEQWMGHIPVYAVTNAKGSGHAIELPNQKTVFYFFLSAVMAEAFLKQLPNQDEDLTVSGLFLGKIWYEFNLLQEEESTDTEYRLVPDPRDLMTAQTLLEIAKGNEATQQLKVKPYNAIPLFGVNSMPLENKSQKVQDFLNNMVSSHYLFFSSRNMLDVLDGMKQEDTTASSTPEEDDWIFLHQVLAEMTLTSASKDYRTMVLVPPAPILEGTVSDKVLAEQLDNPKSFVSQKFLLPLLKE